MNIYEINAELEKAWEDAVDPETGEILDQEALALIDALEIERDAKIEGVGCWIKNLKAQANAIKTEKMALADRQAKLEKKVASLESYLAAVLHGEKFNTAKVAISFRKSEQVEIEEGIELSDEYLTFKEPIPNKALIKKHLKQGVNINGCSIVQRNNIQIK